jgi:hypothetical protein
MTTSKKGKMTSKKTKMEDDLKKRKKGRRHKQKWKTNQSTKINLIGCDTIVNSPSLDHCCLDFWVRLCLVTYRCIKEPLNMMATFQILAVKAAQEVTPRLS